MVRRTKEEATATRELLLDTAEQIFLQQGVARSSLHQIAAAAGLTRGAIYWHFKDKADLFSAMMDRVILPCEQAACGAGEAPGSDALAELRALARMPLQSLRDDERTRRVFRIAIHQTEYSDELAPVRERHQQSVAGYIGTMEVLLRRAQAAGQVAPGIDAHAAALGLFALIDGLLGHATLTDDALPVLDAGDVAIDIYLAGLRAGQAAGCVATP
ncbi:MAG: TetR family transcriptional regulator [Leptothrix sp. (in: b-proteobacteria)]